MTRAEWDKLEEEKAYWLWLEEWMRMDAAEYPLLLCYDCRTELATINDDELGLHLCPDCA